MRYLYADSEPFPLDYDFLATLRAAIKAAASVYDGAAKIESLKRETADRDVHTQSILEALAEFQGAMSAAREAATRHFEHLPPVVAYSEDLKNLIENGGDAARGLWAKKNEQGNHASLDKVATHKQKMREVLTEFVLKAELGLDLTYGRMTPRPDGGYDLRIGAWTAGPIEVDFGVSKEQVPEWKEPRKIEALAGDMILQVGMKKKFLRKDLTRDYLIVTDFVLGKALVHTGGCDVEILRKPNSQKDAILVKLHKGQPVASATVQRPSTESEPFPATESELIKAEHLWQSLNTAAREALVKRDEVHEVRLDGRSVFEEELEAALFDRLLERFTPIVQEIAKRSPSAHELSLKLEHDDGRREEVYLRKSELAAELVPLNDSARAKFAPLGIK